MARRRTECLRPTAPSCEAAPFADQELASAWPLYWNDSLEYALLDLDGDGEEELLMQWRDAPGAMNAIFHDEDGEVVCWQLDTVEMTCYDYPLQDGTMVWQYDYGGASAYTLFRYGCSGDRTNFREFYVRRSPWHEGDLRDCPYYEIDGREVTAAVFSAELEEAVLSRRLTVWRPLP